MKSGVNMPLKILGSWKDMPEFSIKEDTDQKELRNKILDLTSEQFNRLEFIISIREKQIIMRY
jgi:hypothetical protein